MLLLFWFIRELHRPTGLYELSSFKGIGFILNLPNKSKELSINNVLYTQMQWETQVYLNANVQ